MTKLIPLTKNLHTIVNDEDFEQLNKYRWYASGSKGREYAARRTKDHEFRTRALILMHRQILGLEYNQKIQHIDHINGNRLDNRRENLRPCTAAENLQNSVLAKTQTGIGYDSLHNRYKAYVNIPNKFGTRRINVGTFRTLKDARTAREKFILNMKHN